MDKNNLLKTAIESGYESIEDFVKDNIDYLPEDKQRLFYSIYEKKKKNGKS